MAATTPVCRTPCSIDERLPRYRTSAESSADSGMSVPWIGARARPEARRSRSGSYLESVARLADIVFDCERPASLARWWASTLDGYRVAPYDSAELERLRDMGVFDPEDDPMVLVEPALGEGTRYLFQRVPEPKRHKNRLHLDLRSDDLEAEVTRLVDRGAVELYRIDTNVTMADPEGNEFCINAGAV